MADTPVLDLTGLIGRVNTGGNGPLKVVSGTAYIHQYGSQLITTVSFTPLVIFTNIGTWYSETGTLYTVNGYHISFRAKSIDAWQSKTNGKYTHAWQDGTGNILGTPSQEYGYRDLDVTYVILGV